MATGHTKDSTSGGSRETSGQSPSARTGFVLGAGLFLLAVILLVFMAKPRPKAPAHPRLAVAKPVVSQPGFPNFPAPKTIAPSASVTKTAPVPRPAPTPLPPELLSVNQLVDELSQIGMGPVTAAQAARFKADLKELIKRGAASVPAIQKFLAQDVDIAYGDVKGGDQLGYSSLRETMIDALNQIGGPAAQAAMLATLNTTAVPAEILQLAQDLDKQAPGQYHDQIVAGARQTLQMAADGQLGTNTELGPAFRALQNYDGATSTANAANNDPLDFSSAVQLANMPDGQGLPGLLQMEQNSSGTSQAIATQMIAQMAGQNADALDALTQLAQDGKIPQDEWVQLAPILGGDQYQMNSSGQDYTMSDPAMTQQQIADRIQIIGTYLNLVPPGTGAAKALRQQLTTLSGKLGN